MKRIARNRARTSMHIILRETCYEKPAKQRRSLGELIKRLPAMRGMQFHLFSAVPAISGSIAPLSPLYVESTTYASFISQNIPSKGVICKILNPIDLAARNGWKSLNIRVQEVDKLDKLYKLAIAPTPTPLPDDVESTIYASFLSQGIPFKGVTGKILN